MFQPELFQDCFSQSVSKFLATVPWQRGLPALIVEFGMPLAFLEAYALGREPPLEFTDLHGEPLRLRVGRV